MKRLRRCPTPFQLSVVKELAILHSTRKLGHKIHSLLGPQQSTLNPGALVGRSLKSRDQTTKHIILTNPWAFFPL